MLPYDAYVGAHKDSPPEPRPSGRAERRAGWSLRLGMVHL